MPFAFGTTITSHAPFRAVAVWATISWPRARQLQAQRFAGPMLQAAKLPNMRRPCRRATQWTRAVSCMP